jgi:hypothetical protein
MGLAVAGAMAVPAGVSTGAGSVRATSVGVAFQAFGSGTPKTKIVGEGTTAIYKLDGLTVPEDTSDNDCSTDFTFFEIKNP